MTPQNLRAFMLRHGMNDKQLAQFLGVTPMAVINWLGGKRTVSLTVARLLNFFDKHAELMGEF